MPRGQVAVPSLLKNVLTSLVEWVFYYSVYSRYKKTHTRTHTREHTRARAHTPSAAGEVPAHQSAAIFQCLAQGEAL